MPINENVLVSEDKIDKLDTAFNTQRWEPVIPLRDAFVRILRDARVLRQLKGNTKTTTYLTIYTMVIATTIKMPWSLTLLPLQYVGHSLIWPTYTN